MAEDDNVRRMVDWMRAHLGPDSATGVCAVTVHLNRTGKFASMVMNCATMELYDTATSEIKNYTPRKFGKFYFNYATNIDYNLGDASDDVESNPESPFCCSSIQPQNQEIDNESKFMKFIESRGTEKVIYRVKRQVDGGSPVSTQYFILTDGVRSKLEDPHALNKVNSYKNYRCPTHKRFFAVDLYTTEDVFNEHHLRVVPYTEIDQEVLDEFFETAI